MSAIDTLLERMIRGRGYRPETRDDVADILKGVFEERYHSQDWRHFQPRNALMLKEEQAAWAGWITSENPTSGAYQGTSFVWFPADEGSVATLCIGTGGFGPDGHLLARPGHRRRLKAMARLHDGRLWVKPDLLDLQSRVQDATARTWPAIDAALRVYGHVIYAAFPVRSPDAKQLLEDLLDLFFFEHGVRLTGKVKGRWEDRRRSMLASLFSRHGADEVARLLEERRFLVLQGPPGTGKTRLALEVAHRYGKATQVQFHPARTYEDFVVGLAPQTQAGQLAFEVKAGDLLRANEAAVQAGQHVLLIDEINRGDLARVLGEAIYLFEPGEPDREIDLPHAYKGERRLRLAPGLMVLATRNTADRSVARIDMAIRRRFGFLDIWPDLDVVRAQGDALAQECFEDALDVFTEHADDAGLDLTPGHAYFLDPRPDLATGLRPARIARRLRFELMPLLRTYVEERLLGPATGVVEELADRIAARVEATAS